MSHRAVVAGIVVEAAVRRVRTFRRPVAALLAAMILAAGPATVLSSGRPSGALPLPPNAQPGGPSIPLAKTPAATRAAFAGVGLLDAISTCTAVLIRPGEGEPPPDAPAFALTNAHCANLLDTSTVFQDMPLEDGGATIRFGTTKRGEPIATASVAAIRWATMKGTDLAILELAEPLRKLESMGVVAYPMGTPPGPGASVTVVGGPTSVEGGDRILRLATCTAAPAVDLIEHHWAWFGFPGNDCRDILPGSSGSPVFDTATGALVGLINTTTQGSDGFSDCSLGRPCEVTADGVRSVTDKSYGPALDGLAGCFSDDWDFTGPGGACSLDPGVGVIATSWTLASNPGATTVSGSWTSPATWQADLQGTPGVDAIRTAIGRAGQIDCHDPAVYGEAQALVPGALFDPPLPEESGHWLMCALGGPAGGADADWQSVRNPTILPTVIDRTPPLIDVELLVHDVGEAWLVDLVFRAPELQMFDWKWGPADSTDCDDPDGYAAYQVFPVDLPFEDAPTRMCVIGYDHATNRSPTLDQVLTPP